MRSRCVLFISIFLLTAGMARAAILTPTGSCVIGQPNKLSITLSVNDATGIESFDITVTGTNSTAATGDVSKTGSIAENWLIYSVDTPSTGVIRIIAIGGVGSGTTGPGKLGTVTYTANDGCADNETVSVVVNSASITITPSAYTPISNCCSGTPSSTIYVGSATGAQGTQVSIPITINMVGGVKTSCAFSVSFDNTKLQYAGKISGDMGASILIADNDSINATGRADIIVTFEDNGPASGTIVSLNFNIKAGAATGITPLTIGNIASSPETPPLTGTGGSITITGSNCYVSISPSSESFDSPGGAGSVNVYTDCSSYIWTATSNVSWITITAGSSGTGNGTVIYTVSANTNTNSRTGTIYVAGYTFVVTQSAYIISIGEAVDNTSLIWETNAEWFGQTSFYYYGGSAAQSKDIDDNESAWLVTTVTGPSVLSFYWKVSSEENYDYLGFYIVTPMGDLELIYQISGEVDWEQMILPLSSGTGTFCWIYVKDDSWSEGYDCGWIDKVEVNYCNYSISPTNQSFTNQGGNGLINVTAQTNCFWDVTKDASWINITSSSGGYGNGAVYYTVSPNTNACSRTGNIVIAENTFIVTQSGGTCNYSISPINQSFSISGGTGYVSITTESCCSWTATSNVSWLTITSGSNGTGNGKVNYSVAANTGSQRTGIITIAEQTFTVTQEGNLTAECSTWTDAIEKYNSYVSGEASWDDVITCYTQYTSL